MALGTVTKKAEYGKHPMAVLTATRFTVVGDAAYPTGGTAAFKAAIKAVLPAGTNSTILAILPVDTKGYQVAYDHVNDKLKFYRGDNDNVADAPAVEVANAVDLSGVTFELLALTY